MTYSFVKIYESLKPLYCESVPLFFDQTKHCKGEAQVNFFTGKFSKQTVFSGRLVPSEVRINLPGVLMELESIGRRYSAILRI